MLWNALKKPWASGVLLSLFRPCRYCRQWKPLHEVSTSGGSGADHLRVCSECGPHIQRLVVDEPILPS